MPQARKKTPANQQTRSLLILVGLGLFLIVVVVGAITLFQSKDDEGERNLKQIREVAITGEKLSSYCKDPNDGQCKEHNPGIGEVAPTIKGSSFEGEPVSLESNGKKKMVMVLDHSCSHCQAMLPKISTWITANKDKYTDVDFVMISSGTNSERPNYPPSDWFERTKYPLPVMADDKKGDGANALGLGSYPYFVALDKDLKVTSRLAGDLPMEIYESMVKGDNPTIDRS